MRRTPLIAVHFVTSTSPLEPQAVVGLGPVARTLGKRLLQYAQDDELERLRGVTSGNDLLAVLGESERLPWVDGVVYLGCDPRSPRVLIPTTLRPSIGFDLFASAIARRYEDLKAPVAVLSTPRCIFSMEAALPIRRAKLHAWLDASPSSTSSASSASSSSPSPSPSLGSPVEAILKP